MDKRSLSERDICTKFITPAVAARGWESESQVRENVHLTKGRVVVLGKLVTCGTARFADSVLAIDLLSSAVEISFSGTRRGS